MDYKVFYRKYRPTSFNELIGQDSIKEILVNSIKTNKIAHAYIFTGPRGTGKTSTAKIFAKTLNCINNSSGVSCNDCEMCKSYNESVDIIEIDAASNNGVEEIRSLRDNVKVAPYNSKYKVYIIDEVHMLSNSAWNAFLKTLEEPPSHVIFILATTELNKIPETVKSRCQIFSFNKIKENVMEEYLNDICIKESINIDSDAIREIVKLSNGCLRDALSYLDKISKYNNKIDIKFLESSFGIINKNTLEDLYKNIINKDIKKISSNLDYISDTGITPLNFINSFVDYLLEKIISKNNMDYNEMTFIKMIVNSLNNIISSFNSVLNPFILIKIELITLNYFPGNNLEDNNIEISKQETKETDSIIEEQNKINNEANNFETLKSIRINNSFVDASKDLKEDFLDKWKKLVSKLKIKDDNNILGFIENSKVEVVSKTNVIYSCKTNNEAIIFNNNLDLIESLINDDGNSQYRVICLSNEEWNNEKKKFINNKEKKYEYIKEEKNIIQESEALDIANDVFGDKIVEMR